MTIGRIHKEIRRLDPKLSDDDEAFAAAVVLLTFATTDLHRVHEIATFTGLPFTTVREYVRRLRSHGVITRAHKLAVEWLEPDGGLAFWCDVGVALGYLGRGAA